MTPCRCSFVPFGDYEVRLTTEGCPLHNPDQHDQEDQP